MRVEINHDNLNHFLSTIFAMGIAKILCIRHILFKNKNFVQV